jgi:hypothetical protein
MKRIIFCIVSILVNFSAYSQQNKLLQNAYYNDGESLTYALKYGFITGGQATLEVKDSSLNGNNFFHIRGTGRTTGITEKLFHVKDIYESFIDKETGMPVLAIQNIREGKSYKYYNETRFYRQNNIVVSSKSGEHKVKDSILDILSAFYYVRRIDFSKLKEGDVIKLVTFFSDGEFPLELRYRGKENVNTKWGKIRCIKFAPVVEPGRVFKSKDDMLIWYTDDGNRIPLKIIFELKVGHITVELRSYSKLNIIPEFRD